MIFAPSNPLQPQTQPPPRCRPAHRPATRCSPRPSRRPARRPATRCRRPARHHHHRRRRRPAGPQAPPPPDQAPPPPPQAPPPPPPPAGQEKTSILHREHLTFSRETTAITHPYPNPVAAPESKSDKESESDVIKFLQYFGVNTDNDTNTVYFENLKALKQV